MSRISLRWRLTLVTMAVLVAVCVLLTAYSIYNADSLMQPVSEQVVMISHSVEGLSETLVTTYDVSPFFGVAAVESVEAGVATGSGEAYISTSQDDIQIATVIRDNTNYVVEAVADTYATIAVAQRGFNYSSLTVMGVMILLGGLLVYMASGYALRPVRALSREVDGISESRLSTRIHGDMGGQEIRGLADAFNHMLGRLEQAFLAQKQFSTAAAHELKTPLSVIRTNIDVLALDAQPSQEEYAQTMAVVRGQTERMSQLVDDLFAMSSLEEYEMGETVHLDELIAQAVSELRPALEAKSMSLSVTGCGLTCVGSPVMLGRAIANIVENAVRYSLEGGTVEIDCRAEVDCTAIEVRDTGPGIPPEHLPHIFEAFYRADPSRSRKLGGAGLGLAIADAIVIRHGGTIGAQNLSRGGACFTVRLPLSN